MSSSQELDRVQEKADKTTAELRRTQAELRVTQVSTLRILINLPSAHKPQCFVISFNGNKFK